MYINLTNMDTVNLELVCPGGANYFSVNTDYKEYNEINVDIQINMIKNHYNTNFTIFWQFL